MINKEISKLLYGLDNVWENFSPNENKIDHQGWNGAHSALSYLNPSFGAQVIIDLGVWKGQSTITLARLLKENKIPGVVISVDTFLGSVEHQDMGLYSRDPGGRPDIYDRFLNNIWSFGLQDYVIPFAQTTTTALQIFKSKKIIPTFIHVDASHEYEDVKKDVFNYYQFMPKGAVMVCDDYIPGWPGVVKAVDELIHAENLSIINIPPKCIIKK